MADGPIELGTAREDQLSSPSIGELAPSPTPAPQTPYTGNGELATEHRDTRKGPHWRTLGSKVLHFLVAIFLFILAIQFMKVGADALGPELEGTFPLDNAFSTLGLGWLGAYFVLSGSPVAAVAVALFGASTLTELQAFTMLTGSRMGAAFIVLLVGFIYVIRKGNRRESLGMGVLALSLTAAIYIPGMLLGYGVLKSGVLSGVELTASAELQGVIDYVWGPLVRLASDNIPAWVLFPLGLGVILLSFKFLDRVLPEIDGDRTAQGKHHWLKKPWPMFFLGCLACLLTLSVSVAMTALVPLAAKGYIDRREAMPYIMGANITTLADTLVVAMLQDWGGPVQVVLAETIGVTVVTILVLLFLYRPLQRGIMVLDEWVVGSTRRLILFVCGLFVLPAVLLLSGRIIGPIAGT